jgi:hypothetical protein
MALVISAGGAGDTGSAVAAGPAEVIGSGDFGSGTVDVFVDRDGGRPAWVHTLMAPGAVALQSASGTKIAVEIQGGNAETSIDVTVT